MMGRPRGNPKIREEIMITLPHDPLELTKELGRKPNIDTALKIISWEIGDISSMIGTIKNVDESPDKDLDRKLFIREIMSANGSILFQSYVIAHLLGTDLFKVRDSSSADRMIKVFPELEGWLRILITLNYQFGMLSKNWTYAQWHPEKASVHKTDARESLQGVVLGCELLAKRTNTNFEDAFNLGVEIARDRVCDRRLKLGRFKYYKGDNEK